MILLNIQLQSWTSVAEWMCNVESKPYNEDEFFVPPIWVRLFICIKYELCI